MTSMSLKICLSTSKQLINIDRTKMRLGGSDRKEIVRAIIAQSGIQKSIPGLVVSLSISGINP